jgi:hypothetical protein
MNHQKYDSKLKWHMKVDKRKQEILSPYFKLSVIMQDPLGKGMEQRHPGPA